MHRFLIIMDVLASELGSEPSESMLFADDLVLFETWTEIGLKDMDFTLAELKHNKKVKSSFYTVRWTAQSGSHFFPPLADLFIPTPFSASPGSILASLRFALPDPK